jgi:hypothetical protein
MEVFTAKVYQVEKAPKAPKRITLKGNKQVKPESAQHVIEFPGGAIEVSRTSDGNYWAHIIVHRGQVIPDAEGLVRAQGEVLDGRIDTTTGVHDLPNADTLTQIAVLIRPHFNT